jgi:hypothetical protein
MCTVGIVLIYYTYVRVDIVTCNLYCNLCFYIEIECYRILYLHNKLQYNKFKR